MTKEIELTFCESVLILIVVDNGLVLKKVGVICSSEQRVLILIVVDNGLVPKRFSNIRLS